MQSEKRPSLILPQQLLYPWLVLLQQENAPEGKKSMAKQELNLCCFNWSSTTVGNTFSLQCVILQAISGMIWKDFLNWEYAAHTSIDYFCVVSIILYNTKQEAAAVSGRIFLIKNVITQTTDCDEGAFSHTFYSMLLLHPCELPVKGNYH